MLNLEEPFPSFSLTADDGSQVSSLDLRGAPHLIFFVPKPRSRASRLQLTGFRDAWAAIQNAELTVYAVTYDSPEENRQLIKDERLPFSILSDSGKILAEDAEARAGWFNFPVRVSFLMAADGTLKKVYTVAKPSGHADRVLADLRTLNLQPQRLASKAS